MDITTITTPSPAPLTGPALLGALAQRRKVAARAKLVRQGHLHRADLARQEGNLQLAQRLTWLANAA